MKKQIQSCIAGGVLALGMASGASAATVQLDYQGASAFGSPALYRAVDINLSGQNMRVAAGLFRMEDTSTGAEVLAWCVDLYNRLRPSATYDVSSFRSSSFSASIKDNVDRLFTGFYASVDTRDEAAGFQMALWEIVTETSGVVDLASGIFRASGAAIPYTLASGYLSGLAGAGTGAYDLTFFDSLNDSSQNLVNATPSPVPVPAAGGLLLAGLGGLAALRRRRKA